MGQQQLLLLVLATVIVGLATVAGINAFEQNQKQAAADQMTQEAMRIASDVQALALKPDQFSSLDAGDTLGDIEIKDLEQYSLDTNDDYAGPNAVYNVSATPNGAGGNVDCSGATNFVHGYNPDNDVEVCVEINGTGSSDIGTSVYMGS
jgi:hypothetical protein